MGNSHSCLRAGRREQSAAQPLIPHPARRHTVFRVGGAGGRERASIQDQVATSQPTLPPEKLEELMKGMDSGTLLFCRGVSSYWRAVADLILEQRALAHLSPSAVRPSANHTSISIRLRGANAILSFSQRLCQGRVYYAQRLPTGSIHMALRDEPEEGFSHSYHSLWHMIVDFCSVVGRHLSSFTLEIFCSNRGMGHQGWSLFASRDLYTLLLQMPALQGLTMRGVLLRQSMNVIPNPVERDAWYQHNSLPPLQHLHYLNLLAERRFWSCDMVSAWFLLSYGPQLKTLRVNDGGLYTYFTGEGVKPLARLESLHLSTLYNERAEEEEDEDDNSPNVLAVAPHGAMPALTSLWVKSSYLEFVQMLVHVQCVADTLEELHLEVVYRGEDDPLREEEQPSIQPTLANHASRTHVLTKKWAKNEDFEVSKGVRSLMKSMGEQRPLLKVRVLTLPRLYTSGFWRRSGLDKVLDMVPNLEVLHLSQCNDWRVGYSRGSIGSDAQPLPHASHFILDKLSKELVAADTGRALFSRLSSLRSVSFFPDEETAGGKAFLVYRKLGATGQICVKVDTSVPLNH